MPRAMYHLVVVYAGQSFRWPFRAPDGIEVWTPCGTTCLGVVPQPVIVALLAHAMQATAVQAHVTRALAVTRPGLEPPAPAPRPRLPAAAGRRLRGR